MTTHDRRKFLQLSAGVLAAPMLVRPTFAQAAWPAARPIRAIVPFSAGSTIDILGRIVLDPLSKQLGRTIVVENRGGAGGSLGSAAVAKADPDGYTILINAAAHSGRLPPIRTCSMTRPMNAPRWRASETCQTCCWLRRQRISRPCRSWWRRQRAVASALRRPVSAAPPTGRRSGSTSARGSRSRTCRSGGPEALTEVMTGRVDYIFIGISSGLPFIQNKQLVSLAVSSAKRSPTLPDVPTKLEAGYKDSDFNYWNGMLVPAKTPRPIVDRLYTKTTKVLAFPAVQQKLKVQGVEPAPLTPSEMDAMIRREIALNIKIAKEAGLKFN